MELTEFKPLTHRAFSWSTRAARWMPLAIGIVASCALGGFALWYTWITGTVDLVAAGQMPDLAIRAPVTLYVMVGYLPMAIYYLTEWTMRHLSRIETSFQVATNYQEFPRVSANVIGIGGSVASYFSFLHRPGDPFLLFDPIRWPDDFMLPLGGLVFMGWFNFRFMYLLIWSALKVSRTANSISRLNLLDPNQIKPFAQQGVRSSLLAIVSLSISANLWLDPDSPLLGTATTLSLLVAAAALALFLPTWGIHKKLKEVKAERLKEVRDAIIKRSDSASRSVEDAQLLRADLAFEQRIVAISEWPFDAGSYGRVGLYVLLGLGSWIGAALVERLLEVLTGP